MKTSTQRFLTRPAAEWPQALNSTRANLQEMEDDLAGLIQRATLLHGYLSRRYNSGCGDQGHEASARAAKRALVKVRAALGYSYPRNSGLYECAVARPIKHSNP